jgi:hypothetical protein
MSLKPKPRNARRGYRGDSESDRIAAAPLAEELKRRAEGVLLDALGADAARIAVEVEDDGPQGMKLLLTGVASSFATKQAAERASWFGQGVTWVENRIDVLP